MDRERVNMDNPKISFGAELELSDVDRSVSIPKELGSWEGPRIAGYYMGSELDIVNTKGQYRGVATDPLCITCPVGGEIHVAPTYTVDSQLIRIMRILDLFNQVGVACPNHGHIHVAIPGIKSDFTKLKNLCEYFLTYENQIFQLCCGYDEDERKRVLESSVPQEVKEYLLYGDAKLNADWVLEGVEQSDTVQELLKVLSTSQVGNYDWVTGEFTPVPSSHRTCVNIYNLVKGDTIEFRVFRASINPLEIYSSLKFAEALVKEALKDGPLADKSDPESLYREHEYSFAPLDFDEELAKSWWNTRHTKGRCGCLKKYSGCLKPSEDPIFTDSTKLNSTTEAGMYTILNLCDWDFRGNTLDDGFINDEN